MDVLTQSDNQIVYLILGAIGLLILMSVAIILFFYFSRKKIVSAELDKANLQIEHQKDLLQSTLITQEEERSRIAQDLHDAISSKLNIVSLHANMLNDIEITTKEANRIGETIYDVTSTVLESSRRIAHDLLPPTLQKFGLQAALEELCEELIDIQKFELKHSIEYPEGFLDPQGELHTFRVVQELMNNSMKHSGANRITFNLHSEENHLYLRYQDDGKGFDIEKMEQAKGLGMSGIVNRAIILEGILQIESSPGNGIDINLKIPIKYAD